MLGTIPDAELALRINRTALAVRLKREKLSIPNPQPRHREWKVEEDQLVRTLPVQDDARLTGRRLRAVYMRRYESRIAIPDHWAARAKREREKEAKRRRRQRWHG